MIVTLTANPSLDRTVTLPGALSRGQVQRALTTTSDPGGKGVNVARVVTSAGRLAVAVLPGHHDDPLLLALRERGLVVPDPLLLGVETLDGGELVDETGAATPGLYAVGPPRRGTLWESTAIPEIRAQAAAVADGIIARAALGAGLGEVVAPA